MTLPSWNPTPEALLAEHDWARRLARRLVNDAALADDLAQEATVRALGRGPGPGLRAWIGGVVRNLARDARRARGRRERRETLAARPEALPSAADALERLAVQQEVVRAVLALDEPYRSTIVSRFYESLPPRTIAARQGVPVATVKTRLARGLALLRERLDGEHGGDGRAWAAFLLPLAERASPFPPLLAGALAVNTLTKIVVAAAVAAGLVVWFGAREKLPRAVPEEIAHASAPAELQAPRAEASAPELAEPRREVAPATPAAVAAPEQAPAAAETIHGRVLDPEGLPVAGVELGLRRSSGVHIDIELSSSILWNSELPLGREPAAISGADGRFDVPRPTAFSGYVVSQDARFETVLAANTHGIGDGERILVVAPLFHLRGRVVDGTGAPLADAQLGFFVPRERLELAGLALENSMNDGWSAQSDADGRFEFPRLPAVAGALLHTELDPYERHTLQRDDWHDDELEIVLAEPAGGWLEGRVERDGQPLAGASVTLGYRATTSESDGSFRLPLAGLEKESELVALARGLLPAHMSGDKNEDGSVRWPSFVRLSLSGEALSLAGRVVDEHGAPLAGQEVWLEDASVAYVQGQGFAFVTESVIAGKPDMRHGTKTDAEGRFELGGLDARDYTLRVIDPESALLVDYGPFAAGEHDLRLARPADSVWPQLRGRVVSRAGKPLAGLRVYIDREAGMVGVRDQYFGFNAYGANTVTAEDGSFTLANVPRNGVTLHVGADGVADPEVELDAATDADDLEIAVASSVQLLVRLGKVHVGAKSFAVLDAAGRAVDLTIPTGGGRMTSNSIQMTGTESPVARLSDDGVTLVLYGKDSEELARVAIALVPGRVNTIDL